MMALVVAARNVPHVSVIVPPGSSVTAGGLMLLGGLQVRLVSLDLEVLGINFTTAAARMLLGCLHHKACVRIYVATDQQWHVFAEAWAWLGQLHLNRPLSLSVQTVQA
jgi:hypothetical protein